MLTSALAGTCPCRRDRGAALVRNTRGSQDRQKSPLRGVAAMQATTQIAGDFLKGVCYGNDAFSAPYNESNANDFCPTFGSDPTYAATRPLWGPDYRSNFNGGT